MSKATTRVGFLGIFNMPERLTSYFLPWLLTLAAWPVALVVHVVAGDDGLWMAMLGAASAYLSYITWKTWSVRRQETRVMATGFVTAALTWVIIAASLEPWQADVVKAWALGGMALSIGWNLRHAALSGVRDVDKSQVKEGDGSFMEKIRAFKDAKVGAVKETDSTLTARVHLDAPTTAKEAQAAQEQIAAVAGVDASQVKVLKVPGDESQVDVQFMRPAGDVKPSVWTGPRHLGASIADAPIWLGNRVDGSPMEWWIVGSEDDENPRPLAHTKCTGMSGAGKTDTICMAILQMRERRDVVPVVGDPAKFQQSFGDIEEVLGLAAKDRDTTERLVKNLVPLVEYRAGLFGKLTRADGGKGYKQWVPELYDMHGIPAIFLDIEEAADVLPYVDEEADEALRKLRSVGVHFCASMQTMPHDNISRKTRGQFAQSLAHGQKEYQDAKYALEAPTLEAGADPTKWANDAPGSLYAELTGTPKELWPIDGRAPRVKRADRTAMIEATRPHWAELDEGSYRILAAGVVDEETAPEVDEVEQDFAGQEPLDPFVVNVDGEEFDAAAPLAAPRVSEPITLCEPVNFDRMTDDQARAEILNRINVLASSGETQMTFDAVADLPDLTGRPRGWVYDELERLVEMDVLDRLSPPNQTAVYGIARSVLAEAAAV
jgi:hypothetical protein